MIKIENPATGGDPARYVGPHTLGAADSQYFQGWNAGKRSVALDLKSDAGRRDFAELVRTSAAVINNLRGDQPAKLGLDYASLGKINAGIVCLHISAYGRDNERAAWPGYDFLMQAEAGLMSLTGEPDGPPARFGPSIIDYMTGSTAMVGMLACMLGAQRSGRGCDVDVSLYDVALHQLGYAGTWYLNSGEAASRLERSSHFSLAPVQTFPTADGWILVMCMNEKFWSALLDVLGQQSLAGDPRFADGNTRHRYRKELTAILDPVFRRATTERWLAKLSGVLPVGPVYDVAACPLEPVCAGVRDDSAGDTSRKGGFEAAREPDQSERRARRADAVFAARRGQRRAARADAAMKLAGLRVVDLSVFLPGPYLTLVLADHGAEVIKIEPPDGDPGRKIGLADGPTTVFFRTLNRGKKSVVLNLKDERGRAQLLRLCATADVFVESFRPGVADRLGVGYSQVRLRNPAIVYCSINAFGSHGPYRDRPAHDLAVEAVAGLLSMTLGDDGRPALPGIPMADLMAALHGLSGVLMALLKRQQTGVGDYVEVAMHDALLAALPNIVGPVFAENRAPAPKAERTTGGSAFYRLYDTRDGKQIALAGQELKFVERVLEAVGRPDLVPLCARGPGAHQQPVVECLRSFFAGKTREEAVDWLAKLDVCFAPVNTLLEAMQDPNVVARGVVLVDEQGLRHLAPPVRFAAEAARPVLREPLLGEHTDELLAELEADDGVW